MIEPRDTFFRIISPLSSFRFVFIYLFIYQYLFVYISVHLSEGSDQLTGWTTEKSDFNSRQDHKIFSSVTTLALELTQPQFQWATVPLCRWVKRPACERDSCPPSSVVFKNAWIILHFTSRLIFIMYAPCMTSNSTSLTDCSFTKY